jgi:hypothetical protein
MSEPSWTMLANDTFQIFGILKKKTRLPTNQHQSSLNWSTFYFQFYIWNFDLSIAMIV